MLNALVWAAEGGFGGDGASGAPTTVGGGRCVRDGPFSNLEDRYYGEEANNYCLSRGFPTHDELQCIGEPISPEALESLSEESHSFKEYAPAIEHRAHAFIRESVRGGFQAYTGPYGE